MNRELKPYNALKKLEHFAIFTTQKSHISPYCQAVVEAE